jgi:hypothetical protein
MEKVEGLMKNLKLSAVENKGMRIGGLCSRDKVEGEP